MTPIELIVGKFYIVDQFGERTPEGRLIPIAGPFNTKEEGEKERLEYNIAEDCYTVRYKGQPQTVV